MSSGTRSAAPDPSYRRLLAALSDAALVVNRAGAIVGANLPAAALFGYPGGELLGQPVAALLAAGPSALDPFWASLPERPASLELSVSGRRRDGGEFPATLWLSPLLEGADTLALGVLQTDSAPEASQPALRASEQRYRSLFDDSPVAMWEEDYSAVKRRLEALRQQGVTDLTAYFAAHPEQVPEYVALIRVLDVNQAALKLYGASHKAELQAGLAGVFTPENYPAFVSELQWVAEGQTDAHWDRPGRTLGGAPLYLSMHWSAVPGHAATLSRVIISAIDITERRRAEEALRASESLLSESQDIARLGSYVLEFATGRWTSSSLLDELFGIDAAYVRSVDGWAKLVHPADRPMMVDYFAQEVVARRGRFDQEYRIIRPADQAERWVHGLGRLDLDDRGQPVRMHGTITDITERKRAEEALGAERNLLRTLIDNLPDFIYAKDTASRFTLVNQAAARSLGRPPEEIVGRTDFELHPPELAEQFLADEQTVLRTGQPLIDRTEMMYEHGQERWQLTTTVPLRDGAGRLTGLVGISRNITRHRQAELALQQRLAELEAVNRISKTVRTAQTLDEMLPRWLDITLAMMRASGGSVWLYDADHDELWPAVTRGWQPPAGSGPARPQKASVGVPGHVFVTGQPYVSSDFQQDPYVTPGTRERLPPGGGAGVPIRVGDEVIGTLVINLPPGRAITPGEVNLLVTLTEIAGSAIHRLRLFEQTKKRLDQITTLRAIDAAINGSLDVRVTLDVFLEQVVAQLGVEAADVLLLEPDSQTLQYAAGRGFRTRDFEHLRLRVGEGRAGLVALERRVISVTGPAADDRPPSRRTAALQREDFVGYWGVPLIAKGQVLGVLELFHRSALLTNPEWLAFTETLAGQAALAIENARLFDSLQQANQGLIIAYDATIEGWSAALDLRDKETEGHTRRVTRLTERLAQGLGLSGSPLTHIRRGALLHDIGKMGIPDAILLKPGPLTDQEWTIMRQHPVYAYRLLAPIPFLQPALEIPYCHHERWDGSGYPRGLTGEQIPLAARIFAVVDVWDALCSDRPYRAAWLPDQVREYIRAQAGHHFDPRIVAATLAAGWLNRTEDA